jgi:beta-galactosidase
VKLFLNDSLISSQSFANSSTEYLTSQWDKVISLGVDKRLSLVWKIPFAPGILRAEGYKNGQLIATDKVITAGDPAKIELSADRSTISADGIDLSYIKVKITDRNGVMVPDADNLVHFSIEGVGKLVGVGNGNPISLESAKGSQRTAFSGLCQAVIQSTHKAGSIVLKASAIGLKEEKINITTK